MNRMNKINILIEELNRECREDMERASQEVLKEFAITSAPIPIVKIMSSLGFKVVLQNYEEENLSGIIGVDIKLFDKIGTDKIVSVSRKDTLGHQRFTIAHELCHYIFDFDRNSLEPYYDGYDASRAGAETEVRANTFAANLLMPKNIFIEQYERYISLPKYDLVLQLADEFKVSPTAVKKRMDELKGVLSGVN